MNSIVIVDDHPAIRMAIRALLAQDNNIEVVYETGSSADALAYLRKTPVSLIILDIELPNMDGFSLLKRLKNEHIECKVLFLSSKDEHIYASRAIQVGGNGFISKEKEMSDILSAVKIILSGYSFFNHQALHGATNNKNSSKDPIDLLSNRELTVLRHLAKGESNLEISEQLFISNKTVSTYKIRIMEKLNISSIVELAEYAKEHNLL